MTPEANNFLKKIFCPTTGTTIESIYGFLIQACPDVNGAQNAIFYKCNLGGEDGD